MAGQVAPPPEGAAATELVIVDRVIAVAGDSIILESELNDAILQAEAGGLQMPPQDTPEYERALRQALDQMIDRTLMIQAALRDTLLELSDDEIEFRVSGRIDELVQTYGTEEAYILGVQRFGYTEASYREYLGVEARKELLIQSYMQSRSRSLLTAPVSDAEVLDAFENRPQPQRPETFKFRTIFIQEDATDSAWVAAEEEALAALRRLVDEDADFGELAKELSDDEGSAEGEGSVGWIMQSTLLVPEFKDKAFELPEGSVSAPVRSGYGFHLIRVDRIRAGQRLVRHILFSPERIPADFTRLQARAEEAMARARAGEPFDALQREYGDTLALDESTIDRPGLEAHPYWGGYASAFSVAESGSLVGPLLGPAQLPGTQAISVVELIEKKPAGAWDLDEIQEQLRASLVNEKIQASLLRELREKMHVEVRWGG